MEWLFHVSLIVRLLFLAIIPVAWLVVDMGLHLFQAIKAKDQRMGPIHAITSNYYSRLLFALFELDRMNPPKKTKSSLLSYLTSAELHFRCCGSIVGWMTSLSKRSESQQFEHIVFFGKGDKRNNRLG